MKNHGAEVVCATGFDHARNLNASAIANCHSAYKSFAHSLFTELDQPLAFQLGMDCGPSIGSAVGCEHKVYNLWGEAVPHSCIDGRERR